MRCSRCSGLVVSDYFCGGETIFNAWSYEGKRCINCGAVAELRSSKWASPHANESRHAVGRHDHEEHSLTRKLGTRRRVTQLQHRN